MPTRIYYRYDEQGTCIPVYVNDTPVLPPSYVDSIVVPEHAKGIFEPWQGVEVRIYPQKNPFIQDMKTPDDYKKDQ